jgi:hypothetical protein
MQQIGLVIMINFMVADSGSAGLEIWQTDFSHKTFFKNSMIVGQSN